MRSNSSVQNRRQPKLPVEVGLPNPRGVLACQNIAQHFNLVVSYLLK